MIHYLNYQSVLKIYKYKNLKLVGKKKIMYKSILISKYLIEYIPSASSNSTLCTVPAMSRYF